MPDDGVRTGNNKLGAIAQQFFRFGIVGVLGFIIDAGVLTLLVKTLNVSFYLGRVGSYLCAVTATWFFNRLFTFQQHDRRPTVVEWFRFAASNSFGGLVNYGIYAWMIASLSVARAFPLIGVAAGSLAGMIINFCASKFFVFRAPQSLPVPTNLSDPRQ